MVSSVSLAGVLGLLLVSALLGVRGDHPSPDLQAQPGTSEGCWREARIAHGSQATALLTPPLPSSTGDPAQIGPRATEPWRQPPPKDRRERALAREWPLGALYTAAFLVFVLYKFLQVREDQG